MCESKDAQMSHIIDNNATSQDKHFRKGVYNNNNRYYSLMEGDEHKDAKKSRRRVANEDIIIVVSTRLAFYAQIIINEEVKGSQIVAKRIRF